jgi:hypothetical protein
VAQFDRLTASLCGFFAFSSAGTLHRFAVSLRSVRQAHCIALRFNMFLNRVLMGERLFGGDSNIWESDTMFNWRLPVK